MGKKKMKQGWLVSHLCVDAVYPMKWEEEKIGVDSLINGEPDDIKRLDAPATILSDVENLHNAMSKLFDAIDICSNYVERVIEGSIVGDIAGGSIGACVGSCVGACVGACVGSCVGSCVGAAGKQ